MCPIRLEPKFLSHGWFVTIPVASLKLKFKYELPRHTYRSSVEQKHDKTRFCFIYTEHTVNIYMCMWEGSWVQGISEANGGEIVATFD